MDQWIKVTEKFTRIKKEWVELKVWIKDILFQQDAEIKDLRKKLHNTENKLKIIEKKLNKFLKNQ